MRPTSWPPISPPHPWLRFSLRGLLVVLTVFCILLGARANSAAKQRRAVEMVRRRGGSVGYWHQRWDDGAHSGINPFAESVVPLWLRDLVGEDYFFTVASVHDGKQDTFSDADFRQLADLPWLEILEISGAATDNHLAHLQRLPRLRALDLYEARITDAGLKHLRNLTGLTHLTLGVSLENPGKVTDQGLAYLANLRQLKWLLLINTKATDVGMAHLKHLQALEVLGVWFEPGVEANLKWLGQFKNVRVLTLAEMKITSAGWRSLASCAGLATLDLHEIKTAGRGLRQLAALPKLIILALENSPVAGEELSGFTQLNHLRLFGPSTTDATLETIRGLSNLRWLMLDGASVTDAGLDALQGMQQLYWLSLKNTKVTDAGLAKLAPLTSLSSLYLDETAISDAGLQSLQNLRLGSLSITGTQVTEPAAAKFKAATGLEVDWAPKAK